MSRFPELALAALVAAAVPAALSAQTFGLGREALPEEVAAWDIDVRPDGLGLPEGSGSVAMGEDLYELHCAHCHGVFGEGVDRWPPLTGGEGSLTHERPEKTIESYWPYLSTVFDYINRAMPYGNARSLEPDEVYAITAYILYLAYVVDDDFELSRENFPTVELPNAEGFYFDDRDETEVPLFSQEPCMTDCSGPVTISMRAQVLDVTPEDAAAAERRRLLRLAAEEAAATSGEAPAPTPEAAPEAVTEAPAPEPEPEVLTAAVDPALVAAGERVFRQCVACHQVGDGARNRVGPVLNGIVGSPAAQVEGFRYSRPMQQAAAAGLVWTEEALADYLANPRGAVAGTSMAFAGLRNEGDRDAVIAYLSTFTD